ncbi:nucleoside 2-deoxyribosyltransferase [Pseudoduganella namucuonensis]|uniref:nucleoside 2-deoxyribosyltransferase n=1 Tax=Pseudoduganella namucuonensis TaxID=1035707 RepID=UPI000B83191D|nr:nucleoside 2-deoxyribosyltransferase [Pseudoduganella namucuonensis]
MMHKANKYRPVVYMAGPLFSEGERSYNIYLKHLLEEFCDVYLPQQDGFLMADLVSSGMSHNQACSTVFKNDINAVNRCDLLLILLDGRSIDEGAAVELGYAFALGKACVSLQTDFRRLAPFGNNPMITGAIGKAFTKVDDLMAWIKNEARNNFASYSRQKIQQ